MSQMPLTRMGELQRELNAVDSLLAIAKPVETRIALQERKQQLQQNLFNLRRQRLATGTHQAYRRHATVDPCRIHTGKTVLYALLLAAGLTLVLLGMAGVLA